MKNNYGANIERGIIAEVCEGGYKVQSLTRDGIMTPAIPSVSGTAYKAGDRVYFSCLTTDTEQSSRRSDRIAAVRR